MNRQRPSTRPRRLRPGSGEPGTDPSKICEVKRPLRLPLARDATCRQGIAGPQGLDDVCAMATRRRREMHPDVGRNAQVQVVLSTPATGVRDNNTGHETRPDRFSSDSLFAATGNCTVRIPARAGILGA